jgi:hypothetical protein
MRRWQMVTAGVAAVAVVGSGIGYAASGGKSSAKKPLVILADVERRTLEDSVTLAGTLAREEQRKITAVGQGRVSAVDIDDGAVVNAGDSLLAIDGRESVAENGTVPFFRPLSVGDHGDDVRQLEEILMAAGDSPGTVDDVYTDQTQFALAQWQAEHRYPGATPITQQTVMVALAQSTSYKIGAKDTAALVIGPPAPSASAAVARHTAGPRVELAAFRSGFTPGVLSVPSITVQSLAAVVSEGTPATFIVKASPAPASDIDINLDLGGTATSDDIIVPDGVVTLPALATSVQVSVPTRVDNLVKPDKTVTLTIATGADYDVGAPSTAQVTITNSNVPQIHLGGGGAVNPGASSTITITADQAPVRDTQIGLTVGGDAAPLKDYASVNPTVMLAAGHTSASITIKTLATNAISPDKHVVVSIASPSTTYRAASPSSAVITILGQTGAAALPVVTLQSAASHLVKGQPFAITIGLNKALGTSLTINLSYGGTAVLGSDYTLPGGAIIVPPGTTTLPVQVPTVQDDVVESARTLTVTLAASSAYRIGTPSAATVTIESQVLPEITITANVTNVALGGVASFTIHADQAPTEDTSINYQVIGTAQPGKDFIPLLGTAVLAAGTRDVVVTLRSIKKDVVFSPTDMIVGSWPIRVGAVLVKAGDTVIPGAPLLSLTATNFTVTLKATASDRTKLKVGQHCTVKLTGSDNDAPGTISELDPNVTIDDATKAQMYEGKISMSADLGAADGAAVSIDVTVQQKPNVLTVPVAAVKQNGSGADVVRVMDLAHGGHVTETLVKTGLTEGSYIEIQQGLKGDEVVIVEVDQPK